MTEAAVQRLKERMVPKEPPAAWQKLDISYRDSMRANRALLWDNWGARYALGFSRGEFEVIRPFVRHYIALAYQAESDPALVAELVTLAESYGVLDEQVRAGLAELSESLETRDRLRRGELAADEKVITKLTHSRVADVRVLNRLLYLLRDRPVDEEHLSLIDPWLRLQDLRGDLAGYPEDIAWDRFNLLRLFVQAHGQSQGVHKLRAYRAGLLRQALGQLPGASTEALRKLLTAALPDAGIDLTASVVARLPRAVLLPLLTNVGRTWDLATAPVPTPLPEDVKAR
ncbi:hypothetical protein M8C13_38655 [Crossiella sp. SN42]|uniref:hypothetical protein n=1 Tax=Crossiella sp. SN42 TaxID=2944808 RepID=UPI00207CACBF|nr:hypothetical protein [Crossiella sp. SN42]MCO1581687.1 hypothetical protein [Crossiella sp. SN42]